jgi:uncharacterized membrane protein
LAILAYGVHKKQKNLSKSHLTRGLTGLTLNGEPSSLSKPPKIGRTVEDQYIIFCATLAEFHKTQCYFTIALQIATFVIVYSKTTPLVFVDQNFLLLVSLDGLLPITLSLYTLMTFGKKSWYMIGLSVVSAVLSTVTGIHITRSFTSYTDVPGLGPATCGGVGPAGLCYGIGKNSSAFQEDVISFYYKLVMSIADIFMGCLVIWKILTESTPWWSVWTKGLAKKLTAGMKNTSGVTADQIHRTSRLNHRIQFWAAVFFHFIAVAGLLGSLSVVLFLFEQVITSPFVDAKSWGFGQIVGITIWMGVVMELAYLEYSQYYPLILIQHRLTFCQMASLKA